MESKPRMGAELWHAITTGTTLKIRFILALQSLLFGASLMLRPMPAPTRWALFTTLPAWAWSAMLWASGSLMLWRVLSTRSVPWLAWTSNVFALFTWFIICLSYAAFEGWRGLVGTHILALLMAVFCVLRTEATRSDLETA
jgi:hypothetical protein